MFIVIMLHLRGFLFPLMGGKQEQISARKEINAASLVFFFHFCSLEESLLLDDTEVRLMQPVQLQLLQATGMLPFHQAFGSLSVLNW